MTSKVSFTIRRPTPISRATSSGPDSDAGLSFKIPQFPSTLSASRRDSPLTRSATSSPHSAAPPPVYYDNDSSDAESVAEDELVTDFDKFGVQRLNRRNKVNEPLIIPALQNKDWRELARKRRSAAQFVPPSATAQAGQDGSIGGLGTRDVINSGPILSGLQVRQKVMVESEVFTEETADDGMEVAEEQTDDQEALRAILAETNVSLHQEGPSIDIIPPPISEADALKQDVNELPDAATLDDYDRVPVSQFGAAMLRGMGWKEGTAATRKTGKGLAQPYIPVARPALLGLGAKEQEVLDDGSKRSKKSSRPEPRYLPIIKREKSNGASADGSGRRERSRSPRRSAAPSHRSSPDSYNPRRSAGREIKDWRYHEQRYNDPDGRYQEESGRSRLYERDNYRPSLEWQREGHQKDDRGQDRRSLPEWRIDRTYDSERRRGKYQSDS